MSTTVVTTSELENVLQNYKIHLTGQSSTTSSSSQEPQMRAISSQNPPNWPVDYRRVPDYRPVDTTRDVEGRPNGNNGLERGFLTVMFTGVFLNAVRRNLSHEGLRVCVC
jgi:hypothetical protein